MRLAGSMVAVIVLGLLMKTNAAADERIPLIGGHVTDLEWQIIERVYGSDEMLTDPLWAKRYSNSRVINSPEEALSLIRQSLTYIGYYDVDRDGIAEMFVYFEYWCGNIGCNTDILKSNDKGWMPWQSVTVFDPPALCATNDPEFGLPTLYSLFTAAWWNGTDYVGVCLRKLYCDEEYKSDFERNLAKSLEDRPPCWDVISGLPGSAGAAIGSS